MLELTQTRRATPVMLPTMITVPTITGTGIVSFSSFQIRGWVVYSAAARSIRNGVRT